MHFYISKFTYIYLNMSYVYNHVGESESFISSFSVHSQTYVYII